MAVDRHTALLHRFYPESRFGEFTDIDGTIAFYTRVHALLSPEARVVDFGCGRGRHREDPVPYRRRLCRLDGEQRVVIGLDIDAAGLENDSLSEFHQLTPGASWPIDTASVDVVLSDMVVEHLEDPPAFLKEAHRVLKAGGQLCIRTPNAWSYFAMASRLVPNKLHAQVLSWAQPGRETRDVFPTLYRCNNVVTLKRALNHAGFQGVVYGYEAEPSYLDRFTPAFAAGVLHQKLAPHFLKLTLFAFAKKLG